MKVKTFTQFMNEEEAGTLDIEDMDSSLESSPDSVEGKLQKYIQKTLQNIAQFNIYHWLSSNEAQHLALGDFYAAIQLSLDKIVEQSFIRYNVKEFGDFKEPTVLKFKYDFEVLNTDLEDYMKVVVSLIDDLNTDMEDQNLVNELSVVLESIKTLQYKLQLS